MNREYFIRKSEYRHKKSKISGAVVIIVVALLLLFRTIYTQIDEKREFDRHNLAYTIETDDIMASDSDIEGWTVGDKLKAGLLCYDGSDTDDDGITDKDEIEIYNSNPLKTSTCGDAVPDGYKVSHGYSVSTKFSDKDTSMLADSHELFNVPVNFTIMRIAENAYARVNDHDFKVFESIKPVKSYELYGLHDQVEVDFREFIEDGKEYQTIYGALLGDDYQIVDLNDGIASFTPLYENGIIALVEEEELESDEVIVISLFSDWASMVGYFSGGKLHFWAYESDEYEDGSNRRDVLERYIANQIGVESVVVHHHYVSPIIYNFKKTVCHYTLARMSPRSATWAWLGVSASEELSDCFKHFRTYDIIDFDESVIDQASGKNSGNLNMMTTINEDNNISNGDETRLPYVTGFDVNKDAFSIDNFGSYSSKGGNCSGLSLIASEVYNHGSTDMIGSYECDLWDKEYRKVSNRVSYNLLDFRPEFDTFLDKGLSDYKEGDVYYYSRGDKHFKQGTPDDEFIKFVGVKWAMYNDMTEEKRNANKWGCWSTIEELKSYFDKSNSETGGERVVLADFCCIGAYNQETGRFNDSCGHTVVIYGLEEYENDPNTVDLLVYDNNWPPNDPALPMDAEEYSDYFRIKVKKTFGYAEWNGALFYYEPFMHFGGDHIKYGWSNEGMKYRERGYSSVLLYIVNDKGEPFGNYSGD